MHGPYHSLVGVKNLPYAFQREHSLVYPVQVYDICLAELPQSGDVRAGVGNVYLEEVVFAEMGMEKDHEALPKETPLSPESLWQPHYCDIVRDLVADKHLRFHAVVVQRIQKSVGGNSCASCLFTRIDYKYSHCFRCLTPAFLQKYYFIVKGQKFF